MASSSLGTSGFLLLGAEAATCRRARAVCTGPDADWTGSSAVSFSYQPMPNDERSLAIE